MSEMLTDLMQNIYARISQLGKVIQNLQTSIDALNQTLVDRVDSLVGSIHSMTESVEREGEAQHMVFEQIGENIIGEIGKLREKTGIKDLEEILNRLRQIVETSEEALKPETVDLLLKEVLEGIRGLKGVERGMKGGKSAEDLLDQVDQSLSDTPDSGTDEDSIPAPKFAAPGAEGSTPDDQHKQGNPPSGINPPPG